MVLSLRVKLLGGLLLWSYTRKGEAVSCKLCLLLKLNSAHILCLDSNLRFKKKKKRRRPALKQLKARKQERQSMFCGGWEEHDVCTVTKNLPLGSTKTNSCKARVILWGTNCLSHMNLIPTLLFHVEEISRQ